jgi:hypothetical protein
LLQELGALECVSTSVSRVFASNDAPPEDAPELLVEVVHLDGFHGQLATCVPAALREVNTCAVGALAGLRVRRHYPGELDEGMVPDVGSGAVKLRDGLVHGGKRFVTFLWSHHGREVR